MTKFDFHLPFEGVFHLVGRDGSYVSFSAGYSSVSDALFDCKDWLYKRPDLCFVSFVCGRVLVASAGSFPFADSRVPLSPLGC